MFTSSNRGQSWTPANAGLEDEVVFSVAVQGTTLFAGTYLHGVFVSQDDGQTWTRTRLTRQFDAPNVPALAFKGNKVFAGAYASGVYVTSDNGQNWTRNNNGFPEPYPLVGSLAVSGERVFAALYESGVYVTSDDGANWTPVNNGLSDKRLRFLAVIGTRLFACTESGLFVTGNNGQSWTAFPGLAGQFVDSVASVGNRLYASTFYNGVYFTEDEQTWTPVNTGLANLHLYELLLVGTDLLVGNDDNLQILSGHVQDWAERNVGLGSKFINTVAVGGNNLFAGTLGSGVFRSADQGASWTAASVGLPASANVPTVVATGANVFAGTFGQGVYRSNDNGVTWAELNNGLPPANTTNPQQNPRNINTLRLNGATLLAATDGGVFRLNNPTGNGSWAATNLARSTLSLLLNGAALYAGTLDDGVYRSTDGGQSWQPANKQNLGNLTVSALGVSADGMSIFAGTSAGIYRSDDQGQSWRAVNQDLPGNLVVTSFATSGAKLYAGSVYGVFLSENNGATWTQINAGLLDIYVTSFALSGDKLIAGTKVGGVFISQIPDQTACIGIAAQPASKTITGNQTTSLSVTPSGNQPFQFQWYQGASGDFSRPVADATASTFTTRPLTATTSYWVLVTNGCGSVNSDTATVVVNAAPQVDLAITQTVSPAQAKPGDNVTFNLTVTNSGSGAAFSVTVSDALPSELLLVSCNALGGACTAAGNNLTITFASLGANASAAITIVGKVKDSASGMVRNTASVSAGLGESNLANNTAAVSITVQNTAPVISGLNPPSIVVGSPGFILMVNGANFVANSKVRWNGSERPTTFISASQLAAQIPASDIAVAGTATVMVANPDGQVSGGAIFTITRPASVVRVASASGGAGGTVPVLVELVSQGDENALSFSLSFDPTVLSNPLVAAGGDATSAQFIPALGQAAQGRIGLVLALPAGQHFSAGTRQVAVVTFAVAPNTSAMMTNISFGDQPIRREVSDVSASVLGASYVGGTVTLSCGLEGDVAPRPNGNGVLSVTDLVQLGRFAAGLDTPAEGCEFQRADCAPRPTFGDGRISLIDWVQAGRYAAGIDPPTPAGGPTAPTTSAVTEVAALLKKPEGVWPRLLRMSTPVFGAGQTSSVTVELLAQGEENAASFSLRFDPRQWRFVSATAGEDAPEAALSVNAKQAGDGRVGFALALPPGRMFEAGLRSLLVVTFEAAEGGGTLAPEVAFGDLPAARELADAKAATLAADWMPAAREEAEGDAGGAETPRLFTANADGQGVAAGVVIRVGADGVQRFDPLAVFDPVQNRFVAAPIELSDENEQVFLALFGTGWRNGAAQGEVEVAIDGAPVEILYAGAQEGKAGLDQLNLRLPLALRGHSEVSLQFRTGGRASNPVKLLIK